MSGPRAVQDDVRLDRDLLVRNEGVERAQLPRPGALFGIAAT